MLSKLDQNEKNITIAAGFGHFLAHFVMLIFPALVTTLKDEFGGEEADIMKLSFAGFLLYGLGALPAGLLTDKLGGKVVLMVFFVGAAIGSAVAAFSQELWQLGLGLAIIGAAASLYHPAGMTMISRNVREAGYGLGINGMFGNAGLGLATGFAGLVTAGLGWRYSYIIMVVAFGLCALGLAGLQVTDLRPSGAKSESEAQDRFDFKAYLLPLLIFAAAIACAGVAYRSVTLILPTYFEKNPGMFGEVATWFGGGKSGRALATIITSTALLVGIVGQYIGGRLADRTDLRLGYIAMHSLAAPCLVLLILVNDSLKPFAAGVYFFFAFAMQPLENSIVAALSDTRSRGMLFGCKFTLTFGVGALGVYAAGLIEEHFSLKDVFYFSFGAAASTAVLGGLFYLLTRAETSRFRHGASPVKSQDHAQNAEINDGSIVNEAVPAIS